MEVVDSSDEDEVGGTAAAGGGAGPPDGTVLLFTIRPCNKKVNKLVQIRAIEVLKQNSFIIDQHY